MCTYILVFNNNEIENMDLKDSKESILELLGGGKGVENEGIVLLFQKVNKNKENSSDLKILYIYKGSEKRWHDTNRYSGEEDLLQVLG